MFVLTTPPPPAWVDVAPGIRIAFRSAGTECLSAGRRASRAAVREFEDADATVAFVVGCAQWGAVDWEGIGDEGGAPLAISAEGVAMLLRQRPDIYQVVDDVYVGPLLELLSEKKGSSPLPTGTSDRAAPPTAKPARKEAKTKSTAPSAPTANTTRKPRPVKPSGQPSGPAEAS